MRTVDQSRVESAKAQAVRQRNYRRARDRALSRLSKLYPDSYKELFEQEKEKDETLGKKWIDLAGNTYPVDWHNTTNTEATSVAYTRTSNTDEIEGDTR